MCGTGDLTQVHKISLEIYHIFYSQLHIPQNRDWWHVLLQLNGSSTTHCNSLFLFFITQPSEIQSPCKEATTLQRLQEAAPHLAEGGAVIPCDCRSTGCLCFAKGNSRVGMSVPQGTVEQQSGRSVSLVVRVQSGGSAGPGAPGREMLGSRLGFGSSFILRRTFWQAFGSYSQCKITRYVNMPGTSKSWM